MTSEECVRDRQGDLLFAIVFLSYLTVIEPAVSHLVQIDSQFVVDEEVKVLLIQLGHLALCEEVATHLFGQFIQALTPDLTLELLRLSILRLLVKQIAKLLQSRVLLEPVSAVDDLGIGVGNVLYFGGLIACETKCGNQSDKLETFLCRNDHVWSLVSFLLANLLK